MNPTVDCLDHVGLMGPDLGALARIYERLGFALTPLSQHSGALKPGEQPVKWGTGNHCAMLPQGYVELLAVIEPTLFVNRVPEFLARYAGIHVVAFGCRDAAAEEARLRAGGVEIVGQLALERAIEVDGVERTLRFVLIRLAPDTMPEGRILLIEHKTRDLLWRPEVTAHPNGARRLAEVMIAVADADEAADRYARLLGFPAARNGAARTIRLPRGRCTLVSPDGLDAILPGAAAPTIPFVAGVRIDVADVADMAARLKRAGIPFRHADGQLIVAAGYAGGATCVFGRADAGE